MRLCILECAPDGGASEFASVDERRVDFATLLGGHTFERHALRKATAACDVRALAARGFDAFVNLCDGASDEDAAGIEVVLELERLGVPFTGAASAFYDPPRRAMKDAWAAAGIDTPRGVFVRDLGDLGAAERLAAGVGFPLIVKHAHGYGSVGLTRASKVTSRDALEAQTRRTVERFGGALVEEFIEGREFTVLVAEALETTPPIVFPALECVFGPGEDFKHFDLKWHEFRGITWRPCDDASVEARLRDAALRAFVALGGTGYARCDFRASPTGRLSLLEINPNCGIFYDDGILGSADLILTHAPMGRRGFLQHLLRCAFKRADEARGRRA